MKLVDDDSAKQLVVKLVDDDSAKQLVVKLVDDRLLWCRLIAVLYFACVVVA